MLLTPSCLACLLLYAGTKWPYWEQAINSKRTGKTHNTYLYLVNFQYGYESPDVGVGISDRSRSCLVGRHRVFCIIVGAWTAQLKCALGRISDMAITLFSADLICPVDIRYLCGPVQSLPRNDGPQQPVIVALNSQTQSKASLREAHNTYAESRGTENKGYLLLSIWGQEINFLCNFLVCSSNWPG